MIKPVVLTVFRCIIVLTFLFFFAIMIIALFLASMTVFTFGSLSNQSFWDTLSIKEAHQRQQVGRGWSSSIDMFERDLPYDDDGVLGLPVSPELAFFIIQKIRLLAIALPEVFDILPYRVSW